MNKPLPEPVRYILDTGHFDNDSTYMECMVCSESMTIRLDDLFIYTDGTLIAIHAGCLGRAREIWGERRVIQ